MEKLIDSFEFRILTFVFRGIAILFGLYYAYELAYALCRSRPLSEAAFLVGGLLINGGALAAQLWIKKNSAYIAPLGVAFAVANVLFRQSGIFFVDSTPVQFALGTLLFPLAVLSLGFYFKTVTGPIIAAVYVFVSDTVAVAIFPSAFFRQADYSVNQSSVIINATIEILCLSLFATLALVFMNTTLRSNRHKKQEYLKKLSHYDQETGLPNIRELSSIVTARLKKIETRDSVVALAGLRILKIEELSERLGYENMINWLLRFSAELTASLDLWRRDACGPHDKDMIQLFRLETSLLFFPVELPKRLLDAPGKFSEAWNGIVHEVLQREHVESLIDFYGAYSVAPNDGTTTSELLNNVLNILHRDAPERTGEFIPFNAQYYGLYLRQERIKGQMTSASFASELFTVFQPKVSPRDGTCREFEALMRWKNPILGFIPPGEFIPLAEQTGAIDVITRKSLEDTKNLIERCANEGLGKIKISFNLSPTLVSTDYLSQLGQWVADNSLAHSIEIEITEGILLNSTNEIVQEFESLKAMGIGLSIDDFGTGYSNLSYIQRFNPDVIKIDKGFIDRVPTDEKGCRLVQAIVLIIKAFGIACVAEGVETAEQLEFLNKEGCDLIQGYFYSKPIEADDAVNFMKAHNEKKQR